MATSEARIKANQLNSSKSRGPKTQQGKEVSRQNSFKHGLTGAGVVIPPEDVAEVERRMETFRDELKPSGDVGEALVRRAAFLSVRLDRAMDEDLDAMTERVRKAQEEFVAPEGASEAEVARLRAEAATRAITDLSPERVLARKYEAAAERSFYRALKELRQVERSAQAASEGKVEEMMASILKSDREMDRALDRLEAKIDAMPPVTPARPANRPQSTQISPMEIGNFVPISIGRRP
jgi:hypothetical protein